MAATVKCVMERWKAPELSSCCECAMRHSMAWEPYSHINLKPMQAMEPVIR